MRSRRKQIDLDFRQRGGAAGRKPKGPRGGVSHHGREKIGPEALRRKQGARSLEHKRIRAPSGARSGRRPEAEKEAATSLCGAARETFEERTERSKGKPPK